MKAAPVRFVYRVEVEEGEKLCLPEMLVEAVPAGEWLITIEPVASGDGAIRNYDAFPRSYSDEHEGLYDDLVPGRGARSAADSARR
ncbi:MAG: hypothetical protein ACR2HN_01730 [Tepidiformaceae bacterium]